jgi:hypothetical protein
MKTFHPAAGFWLQIAAVGLLAAALLLGGAGLAQAHAVFLRSDPATFYQKAARRSYILGALAAAFVFAVGLVYLVWQIGSLAGADAGAPPAGPAGPLVGLNQMLFGATWATPGSPAR